MTRRWVYITLAALVGGGLWLPSQAEAGKRNAALEYWMIVAGLQGQDQATLAAYEGDIASAGWTPRAALLDRREWLEDTMDRVVRACDAGKCDFGLTFEQGPQTPLRHLRGMSRLSLLLRLDARLQAQQGDREATAERIGASIRMVDHLAGDETLPSSQLAASSFSGAERLIRFLEDRGDLTSAFAGPILDALDDLDEADPFGFVSALERTRDITVEWARDEVKAHDGPGLPESVANWLAAYKGGEAALGQIETAEGFLAFVDFYEVVMDQAIDMWDEPRSVADLARLERDIRVGAFGPVAKVVTPSLAALRRETNRAAAMIRDIRDLLDPS